MASDPIADRALITAISRKDMAMLTRALAEGANANKTIKRNQWDGHSSPLLVAAEYGWHQAFAVLVEAGAKRWAPGRSSIVWALAKACDDQSISELARVMGGLTGGEIADGLDGLRSPEIDTTANEEKRALRIESTFEALVDNVPAKMAAKDRVRCAQMMFGTVSLDFQRAMGARRAFPLDWMERLGRALPPARRLISSNTPGAGDEIQAFSLMAAAGALDGGGLIDIGQRLDMSGREFAIDLGCVLEIRSGIDDLAGNDYRAFAAAYARQQDAMLHRSVASAQPGATPRLRM